MKFVLPTDPILRQTIPPFSGNPHDLRGIAREMWRMMRHNSPDNYADSMRHDLSRPAGLKVDDGLGLAAPQVGLAVRMFITQVSGSRFEDARVCINPVALFEPEAERASAREGCLTKPGYRRSISRPRAIVAKWTDLKGKLRRETLHDLAARVFLHELDHLDGVCVFPTSSNPPGEKEDREDQQDDADASGRVIAPGSRVRPDGEGTDQRQDQDDEKNYSNARAHSAPPRSADNSSADEFGQDPDGEPERDPRHSRYRREAGQSEERQCEDQEGGLDSHSGTTSDRSERFP